MTNTNEHNKVGTHYRVVVGNVGTVYSGQDRDEATRTFHAYVAIAAAGIGRAASESVVLLRDDDIYAEKYFNGADDE